MEEMEQKKTITRSYRVDDETAEKIAALGKELGINQNGVFEALLSAYELQQDATLVPDAAKDIATFISHLKSIQDAYHHIVGINAQTEERVRQEFQRRLENDDATIADLRDEKERQTQKISTLEEDLAGMAKDLAAKEQALADAEQKISDRDKSLADKATIIDSLTARLPEQAEIDAKMDALEKELANLRASLSAAETAKTEAIAKANKTAEDLLLAKTQADLAHKQAEQERAAAEKTHAKELEMVAKQAAADLKAAVTEAKEAEREKAAAKEEKLQIKIEEYRTKIDEQKDLIADLKIKKVSKVSGEKHD